MAITIELPAQIETHLETDWTDLPRHALEGFAIEAFRNGKLSSYQVGQMLGLQSRWETITFLSERGVYPGYDLEDFDNDMQVQEQIFSGKQK